MDDDDPHVSRGKAQERNQNGHRVGEDEFFSFSARLNLSIITLYIYLFIFRFSKSRLSEKGKIFLLPVPLIKALIFF